MFNETFQQNIEKTFAKYFVKIFCCKNKKLLQMFCEKLFHKKSRKN